MSNSEIESAVGEKKKEEFVFYLLGGSALVPAAVSINTENFDLCGIRQMFITLTLMDIDGQCVVKA